MKLKHALSLTSLAVCAALSSAAFAQSASPTAPAKSGSAVVFFEGYVVDELCTVEAGNGNYVTLPTVPKAKLAKLGDIAGEIDFEVKLKGCKPEEGTVQINFSDNTAENGRLPNTYTTGAKNVSLEISSAIGKTLYVGKNVAGKVDLGIDPGFEIKQGSGKGVYKVAYFAEGESTSGRVQAGATMTVNYL